MFRIRRTFIQLLMVVIALVGPSTVSHAEEPEVKPSDRILILGDSNTHAGGYVDLLESWLTIHQPDADCHHQCRAAE